MEDLAVEPAPSGAPAPLAVPPPASPRPASREASAEGPASAVPGEARDLVVRVRTTSGRAVPGATAYVEDTDPVARGATTDTEGRAGLRTSTSVGWALVRSKDGVWGRERFEAATTEVDVTLAEDRVLWGRVTDASRMPSRGLRLRVRGTGRENPARAWPGVRRWEMRSEDTEVVTDRAGALEVTGLASPSFLLSVAPEAGVLSLREGPRTRPDLAPDGLLVAARRGPVDLVVAQYVEAVLLVRDAVSGAPVRGPAADAQEYQLVRTGEVRTERTDGGLRVVWPRPPFAKRIDLRMAVRAPGYEPTAVTLDAAENAPGEGPGPAPREPHVVVLRRDASRGAAGGALRLAMPPGVRSLVATVEVGYTHARDRRGARSQQTAVNRGDHWEIEVPEGGGQVGVSSFLGFEIPEWLTLADGEVLEVPASSAPWGPVELRLTADADLCRGEFQAEAKPAGGTGYLFRVTADADGRAEAGWWPAGSWTFRVFRSAEEGTSEAASVRPGTETTTVDVPVRNLLTR